MRHRAGLVSWQLLFTSQAQRDAKKITGAGFRDRVQRLLDILRRDPYQTPPPYERLVGDLKGACSRRINIRHRLVYQILEAEKIIKVLRMWTHYE